MPSYDYVCEDCCATHEEFHRMADAPLIKCLLCGGSCHKVPVLGQFIFPADASWHGENNGKGKYISGLGRKSDPDSYATSLRQAEEKAKRRGLSYEKA